MEGVIGGWGAGYVDDDVVVERVVDACVNLCLLSGLGVAGIYRRSGRGFGLLWLRKKWAAKIKIT